MIKLVVQSSNLILKNIIMNEWDIFQHFGKYTTELDLIGFTFVFLNSFIQ